LSGGKDYGRVEVYRFKVEFSSAFHDPIEYIPASWLESFQTENKGEHLV